MLRADWMLVLVLLAPSVARGDDALQGPALNWVRLPGAEGCITAGELVTRVEARLERKVFVLDPEAALSFDGHVEPRAGGGWQARLAVANARGEVIGERKLETTDASCRALDDPLVLITALTLFPSELGLPGGIALDAETSARLHALFGDEPSELDPGALPEQPAPAATPVVAPTATAKVIPRPSRAEDIAPQPEPSRGAARSHVALEGGPLATLGVLPGVALGMSAELTVRLDDTWPLRLGVAHFFEREQRAELLESGGGSFARTEGSLFACPYAPDARWALELCAGAAVGVLQVSSQGFADGGLDASDPVLDVGASAGLRALLGSVLLARLSFAALLPVVQNTYEYQALDASTARLFRTSQVGMRLQFGMGAQF